MIINLLNNYLVLVVQKLNLCSRTSYLLGSQKEGGQEPNVFEYSSTSSSSTDEVEQTEDYVDLDDVSESLWSE